MSPPVGGLATIQGKTCGRKAPNKLENITDKRKTAGFPQCHTLRLAQEIKLVVLGWNVEMVQNRPEKD